MSLHNLDVEAAFLGALLDNNNLRELAENVEASHFHEPLHRKIAEDVFDRIASGRAADPLSLRDRFKDHLGYLLRLVQAGHLTRSQFTEYGGLISDLSTRRAIKAACDDTLADLRAGYDATVTLAAAEQRLHAVPVADASKALGMAAAIDHEINAPPGLRTGYASIDRRLGGLHPGDLIILAARPSMGKSALARNIAVNLAWRDRFVHFASLEMSEAQIGGRTVSAMSFGKPGAFEYTALRRGDQIDLEHVRTLARRIPKSIVIDDRGAQTLAMLEGAARETRRRLGGLNAIVVDYLQIMRAVTSENRVQQVTEISSGLKAMAKRFGVPVIALSQLSRANESREDRRPLLSDLRDSGSLEQDADVVIGLYRESYYIDREEPQRGSYSAPNDFKAAYLRWSNKREAAGNSLEAITLKQRHGPIGTDMLEFHPAYDVINEPAGGGPNLRVVGE
jgi:replicative DNA helicase